MDKTTSTSVAPSGSTSSENKQERGSFWFRTYAMYRDGFKYMSKTSRQLWILVLVKLFVMFAILRAFLFPNFLNENTDGTEEGKSAYVTEQFVNRALP